MKTIKRIAFSVICLISCLQMVVAQEKLGKEYYHQAYSEIANMLEGKAPLSIRRAVFLAEWAYLDGNLDYEKDFASLLRKQQIT